MCLQDLQQCLAKGQSIDRGWMDECFTFDGRSCHLPSPPPWEGRVRIFKEVEAGQHSVRDRDSGIRPPGFGSQVHQD